MRGFKAVEAVAFRDAVIALFCILYKLPGRGTMKGGAVVPG
jgi:hypothetical protein